MNKTSIKKHLYFFAIGYLVGFLSRTFLFPKSITYGLLALVVVWIGFSIFKKKRTKKED